MNGCNKLVSCKYRYSYVCMPTNWFNKMYCNEHWAKKNSLRLSHSFSLSLLSPHHPCYCDKKPDTRVWIYVIVSLACYYHWNKIIHFFKSSYARVRLYIFCSEKIQAEQTISCLYQWSDGGGDDKIEAISRPMLKNQWFGYV